MIIKTKICAGGDRSLTRFPIPKCKMEDCLSADGQRLDPAKALLAFTGDTKCFQTTDGDDIYTLWASLTFCELLSDALTRCVNNPACDLSDHATTHQDERIIERIDRRCVWVRQMVTPNADGVKVKIRVDNPMEVIGQSLTAAEDFAATCCQLWLRIVEQTTKMRIRLEADPEIVARARADNARAELRERYAACPNRRGGYCAPLNPECPCYRNGGCAYSELA